MGPFPAREPAAAKSGGPERLRIILIVGAMAVLLLGAVVILILKGSPASQAEAPSGGFSESFARPASAPVPLEAPPSSREVRSHMLMPTMGEEPQEKLPGKSGPAAAKGPPREELPQDEEPSEVPEPKTGNKERAAPKLNARDMDSGSRTRSFGSSGGGGVSQPAEGGERKAAAAASRGMEAPAQPAATPEAQGGARSRLRSLSGTGAPEAANFRQVQPFQKDPKGERQSDEAGVKPGWVQMDNGQYIHIIEMSGAISEGGKDGQAAAPGR